MNCKNEHTLIVSVVLAGFTALVVQVIFLREFLGIFMGNELVAGIIIGNWMILTAAGTKLGNLNKGGKNIFVYIIIAQVLFAVLPQISILLISIFKSIIYPPGALPGFIGTWLFSFLVMAPFCIVSGALFSLFLKAAKKTVQNREDSLIYGLEAIGSVAGGIIFTFLLLRFLTTFQILLILATVNFGASLTLVFTSKAKRQYFHVILVLFILMIAVNYSLDFDRISKSFLYGNQEIVLNQETPFGNLVVTKTGSQYNFYENGLSLFSTDNVITKEESVHYAMLQHPDPKEVLLVSGGISGLPDEILKYNVGHIDYVEINPAIVAAGKRFAGFNGSPLMEVHNLDARSFIKKTAKKFDIVLLNLPPPSTAQLNCYFTAEFYNELKKKLNSGAIISTSLDGGSNYLGKEAATLHGILFQTLKSTFQNVIIIPGQANYFLASDAPLGLNIVERLENRDFENDYVNKYYLDDETIRMRASQLQQFIPTDSPVNHDFHPVAYFARINYWLSWFGIKIQYIASIAAIVFFTAIFFLSRQNRSMFVSGFSVSAIEIMVLFAFQVTFGFLYIALALLIAAFMAGLAVGTYLSGRYFLKPSDLKIQINQLLTGFFALIIPLILVFGTQKFDNEFLMQIIFYVFMIIPGILTGIQYSWISATGGIGNSGNGAAAYSADLFGSAGGALLAPAMLIPVAGFVMTGVFLFGLNVFIILINSIWKR